MQKSPAHPIPSTLSCEKQQRILRRVSVELHDHLDIDQMFPHLIHHNLLNNTEQEQLRSSYDRFTKRQKITKLSLSLPSKGKDALKRFVDCLYSSQEGTGSAHADLASHIEDEAQLVNSEETQTSKFVNTVAVLATG